MANETIEVERISDLAEGRYSDDSWLVIDTGTVVLKLKLKDAVPDASTEVKGKVQLSDSTNNGSSHVAATSKAVKSVMDALTQVSEGLSNAILEKYSKPSSGIPMSDLSSAVQTSLENGDNAVAALAEIGKPLVWHGDADVATLNGTIEGLQNGWTFTLTDSGTLTAGSVSVEVGDEVAWTGSAWFKLGGDGKGIVYITTATTYNEVSAIISSGKLPVMRVLAGQGDNYFYPSWAGSGLTFVHIGNAGVTIKRWDSLNGWTDEAGYDTKLSSESTNAVQNATLYAVIGNVETLLAAL